VQAKGKPTKPAEDAPMASSGMLLGGLSGAAAAKAARVDKKKEQAENIEKALEEGRVGYDDWWAVVRKLGREQNNPLTTTASGQNGTVDTRVQSIQRYVNSQSACVQVRQ
jgi:hypothetical protein